MKLQKSCLFATLSALLILGSISGCGGGTPDDLPKLEKVTGVIKVGGKPTAGLSVSFSLKKPLKGKGTSTGKTDKDGKYTLHYGRTQVEGVVEGEHVVRIVTVDTREANSDGPPPEPLEEKISEKYNKNSTLFKTVKSGEQTIDFDLEN